MRAFRALLLLFVLAVLSTAVSAESVVDYNHLLTSISQQLNQASQMEQAKPDSGLPLIKKLWNDCPASVCVPSGKGKSINADMGWVRDELYELQRGKSTNRIERITALQDRLNLLSASISSNPGIGSASAKEAKSTLKQVLANNEYKPSLYDRVMSKIYEAIGKLLSHLNVSGDTASAIGWLIITLAVIVFIVVVVYLVLCLVRMYSGRPDREHSVQRAKLKSNRRLTPESVLDQAERDAVAGRYREAFRGIYLASILLLDRAKLVKYTEGVTNWEYLRTLKRGESQQPVQVFSDMTMQFDEYIYGNRAVTSGDYDRTLTHYRKLEGVVNG